MMTKKDEDENFGVFCIGIILGVVLSVFIGLIVGVNDCPELCDRLNETDTYFSFFDNNSSEIICQYLDYDSVSEVIYFKSCSDGKIHTLCSYGREIRYDYCGFNTLI